MGLMYFNLSSKYNQLQKESTQQKHQITLLQNNINDLEREYIQVNKKYKFIASFVNENFYMLSKYDSNYHLINCAYILNRGYTRYSSNDYASLPTPMCRLCYEAMVETYN